MSWDQERDRQPQTDMVEINEAVGKLLESFNYDSIVPQPTKWVISFMLLIFSIARPYSPWISLDCNALE